MTLLDLVRALSLSWHWPIYIHIGRRGGYYVDKLTLKDEGVQRVRYTVTPKGAHAGCDCLGFLKFGNCRHLRMTELEAGFARGVTPAQAHLIYEDVVAFAARHLCGPDATEVDVDELNMPNPVKSLECEIRNVTPWRGVRQIWAENTFGKAGSIVVALIFTGEQAFSIDANPYEITTQKNPKKS